MSVAVLASFALFGGGLWLLVKRRDVKRGVLMMVAATVILGNVLIWNVPLPSALNFDSGHQ